MAGLIDFFIPKEKKFFQLLSKLVTILQDCVEQLRLISPSRPLSRKSLKKNLSYFLNQSEKGDMIMNEITLSLHKTFITPIDREDIQLLALNINRVIDSIEKIVANLYYFKIKKIDLYTKNQLLILKKATDVLHVLFDESLVHIKNQKHIEEIKKLEEKGDSLYKEGIANLFQNHHNAIEIIKRKELYQMAEEAIDDIKHIAEILETILITNS